MTKKLSKSKASQRYIEKSSGTKSKLLSKARQRKLKDAAEKANENIRRNDAIYNTSNSHAHEHPVN